MFAQVVDANINRVAEGYRVLEEYTRFVLSDDALTQKLSKARKQLNQTEVSLAENLSIRNTDSDARAREIPSKRVDLISLLKANFKRVQEGLRVLEEYTGNPVYNGLRYDAYDLEKDILLPLTKPQIERGVYLISDSLDVLRQGLKWKVSLVQLRDKFASKSEIFEKAKVFAPEAKAAGVPFLVNDFLDIAMQVDADGLHTGQDDIPVNELRSIWGEHKLYGRTTHSLDQGKLAQEQGADYVSVGPIWETPSKPGRDGIGFEYLEAKSQLNIPVVAIGGVNKSNIELVMKHSPELVGLIRDYENVPYFQSLF
jgi:thiamine-phosphate pyrophosphorylase